MARRVARALVAARALSPGAIFSWTEAVPPGSRGLEAHRSQALCEDGL
eukprot:CAMPEP_0204561560 /NCGR_PEP_ID=MMETSP0661-20131031/33255_1 /ASSEMBLY_ACC=CAM_ASM_000606 /TAXON_ID=109239 /ORGANISM="Alexandrium margalefi, Strain AMGDE01CS-322" /LENGTH=47 /DNA_ID= /DNA_START= /DNA_END= /DNA_ORIENTATION=